MNLKNTHIMKRAVITLLTLGILALQGCGVLMESREDRLVRAEAEAQYVREAVEACKFKVDITQMIPLQMAPRHVSNYWVKVEDKHIVSNLPYAGRAWDVPYGGGHALNYESDIQETALYRNDDGSYTVRLLIRTDEDTHVYTFQIYLNGKASLLVQSKNRDAINFNGEMDFEE